MSPKKSAGCSVIDVTGDSVLPVIAQTPSALALPTSASMLPQRSQLILKWREEGITYKEIGKRLGLTRQRVTQLWGQAQKQLEDPRTCWCGKLVTISADPGKPQTYCSPEHTPSYKPSRPPRPPKIRKEHPRCWCGELTSSRKSSYCKPGHAFYRAYLDLTVDGYEEMRRAQNDLCAVCGRPEVMKTRAGNIRNLAVDHCHETGVIRELLCSNCNTMLGAFRDDPGLLERAVRYVERSVKK